MNKLDQILMQDKDDQVALMVDISNTIYRCIHVATKEDPLDHNYTYWKSLMISNLFTLLKTHRPDRCIIAMDSKNGYWRKDIYDGYKAKRKEQRTASKVNFDKFFPIMETFLDELKEVLPMFRFLKIDKVEADDIVAVLTKYELKHYKIITISNDSDMHQLKKYRNYNQYDPIKKLMVSSSNPQKKLLIKILIGDTADNIPGVKVGVGKVKAEKFIDGDMEGFLLDEDVMKGYTRNKMLIDFDMIPLDVIGKVRDSYNGGVIGSYSGRKLFNFFIKHKLSGYLDSIQEYANYLGKLN